MESKGWGRKWRVVEEQMEVNGELNGQTRDVEECEMEEVEKSGESDGGKWRV